MLAAIAATLSVAAGQTDAAQSRASDLEYRAKAAHLFNFTKFVEWPRSGGASPLTICVAGANPFGTALDDLVGGEHVNGRPLQTRVVRQPAGCQVLFIPRGVARHLYLPGAVKSGLLTVGETPSFLNDGGIINFIVEEGRVRFDINQDAATRANLVISSRLLRLARQVVTGSHDEMPAR